MPATPAAAVTWLLAAGDGAGYAPPADGGISTGGGRDAGVPPGTLTALRSALALVVAVASAADRDSSGGGGGGGGGAGGGAGAGGGGGGSGGCGGGRGGGSGSSNHVRAVRGKAEE